jgi:DNA-binding NarL/FixJ family response regulator
MNHDLLSLYSTPIDSLKRLQTLPQHAYRSHLNCVFTYIAQEVAELLQQSHHFPVNYDNKPNETIAKRCCVSRTALLAKRGEAQDLAQLTIREIEPEYKFIITVEPLTERELEVLQLIVDGHSNKAIARKLYITVNTVKTHIRNIFRKLSVNDRTQAAIQALRSGLVH